MKTRRAIAMLLAVGLFLAAGGAAEAGTVTGQFDWYDIIESNETQNSWTEQVVVVDTDSGESATIDFTLTNSAGEVFSLRDVDRGAVGAGADGNDIRSGENLIITASLVSQTGALGIGVNVTDLGIRGRGTLVPVTLSWSSSATAGPVVHVNPPTEDDYATDGAADFFTINSSDYSGTLAFAGGTAYQFSDRDPADGIQYSVNFGPLPPPSPLSLVNGGFDEDGPTGGFVPAISDWTRTTGNGGWYDAAAGVSPSTSPNMGLLNAGTSTFTGTELTSDPLTGSILPGTGYTLSFDAAVREQGQFGGPANTIANLGTYDVDVSIVGSVDGVLASMDAVPLITSVDTWFPGSLVWDSTGATAGQEVTVVLSATNTGGTHLQFVMDSLTLAAGPVPPPPPPEPLSLLNGGFDDDGTLSGVDTSITGWRLTNFNAGWQTGSPPGGPPSADTDPNVALLNSNQIGRGFPGTELTSDPLAGDIIPGTMYDLSGVAAIRDQGQFGGGQNIVNNLGPYSLLAILEGSVDGELARIDVAPLLASVDNWHPFSLTWDSTGATQGQDVRVLLRIENTGNTDLQFLMDSLEWTAQPAGDIPEPATMAMLGLAFTGLGGYLRRRRR